MVERTLFKNVSPKAAVGLKKVYAHAGGHIQIVDIDDDGDLTLIAEVSRPEDEEETVPPVKVQAAQ